MIDPMPLLSLMAFGKGDVGMTLVVIVVVVVALVGVAHALKGKL